MSFHSAINSTRDAIKTVSGNIQKASTDYSQKKSFVISEHTSGNGRYSTPIIKEYTNLNAEGSPEQTDNNLAVIVSNSYAVPVMNTKTGKIYMAQAGAEFTLDKTNHIVLRSNTDCILVGQAKVDFGSTTPDVDHLKPVDISLYRISDPEQSKSVSLKGTTISSSREHLLKGSGITTKAKNGSKNFGNLAQLMIPESNDAFSLQEGTTISLSSSFDGKPTKFTYGGITKTVMISDQTRLFNVGNTTDVFKKDAAVDINDGCGIRIAVNGSSYDYTFKKDSPKLDQKQFNSMESLRKALAENGELNIRLEGGVLYIGANNPNIEVTFTNITSGGDVAKEVNFMQELGLYNIAAAAAGVHRFNSLQNLAQKIADIESLSCEVSDTSGNIVPFKGANLEGKVGKLGIRVASALAKLNVSGDDLNIDGANVGVWQKTKQMIVNLGRDNGNNPEKTRGILRVYSKNHGLVKGATIQVSDFAADNGGPGAAAPNQNAIGAVLADDAYKQVLDSGDGWFEIALDQAVQFNQMAAVGAPKVVNAFNKTEPNPFKFRLVPSCVYGEELAPDGDVTFKDTRVGNDSLIEFALPADHGFVAGDKILVKNIDAVIKGGSAIGAHGADTTGDATHLNDYVATVVNVGANNIQFRLLPTNAGKFIYTNGTDGGGGNPVGYNDDDVFANGVQLRIQKLATGSAVAAPNQFNLAKTTNASNKVKFYEANSQSKYIIGDTVRLSSAAVNVTLNNTVVGLNKDYKITGVGKDADGEYIEIEGEGNAVADNLIDNAGGGANHLPTDFKIQHVSSVVDYFGFDRTRLQYDEAYNADTMNIAQAAEKKATGKDSDQRVKNIMDAAMINKRKIVTSNGEEREISISYIPIASDRVAVEVAIVRDKYGRYGASGIDEAGDGMLAKGILTFKEGYISNIESQLQRPISISWMANGEVSSVNDGILFNFNDMRFMANQNDFNAAIDGVVPSSITGSKDISIDSDGSINLNYQSGKIANPFRMVLAYANDMSKLRAIGYGLYEITTESGEMKLIYAGNTELTSISGSMKRGSATDMVESQLDLSRFLSLQYAQASTARKVDSNENEVVRTIAAA